MEVLITRQKDRYGSEKYKLSGISEPFTAKADITGASVEAVIKELRSFLPNDTEITRLPPSIFLGLSQ